MLRPRPLSPPPLGDRRKQPRARRRAELQLLEHLFAPEAGAVRERQPHSFEKISIFTDYIAAFVKAAQRAPNRVYIDAFAGDAINVLRTTGVSFAGSVEIELFGFQTANGDASGSSACRRRRHTAHARAPVR